MATFFPRGVCSNKIEFEIENNTIKKLKYTDGCDGNLKGIASLVEGMSVNKVISCLKGIRCSGKSTSCPDQLAKALEEMNNPSTNA